jgi:hypothetical protein
MIYVFWFSPSEPEKQQFFIQLDIPYRGGFQPEFPRIAFIIKEFYKSFIGFLGFIP